MKKICKILLPAVLLTIITTTVHAGSVTANWGGDVSYYQSMYALQDMPSNVVQKTEYKWQYAESNDTFKLNVRIKNIDKTEIIKKTVYKGTYNWSSTALVPNRRYFLYMDRENIWDSAVHCSGSWKLY